MATKYLTKQAQIVDQKQRAAQLLTTQQAADFAQVCETTIRAWIQSGRLRAFRTHPAKQGRFRIRQSDLELLLAGALPGVSSITQRF